VSTTITTIADSSIAAASAITNRLGLLRIAAAGLPSSAAVAVHVAASAVVVGAGRPRFTIVGSFKPFGSKSAVTAGVGLAAKPAIVAIDVKLPTAKLTADAERLGLCLRFFASSPDRLLLSFFDLRLVGFSSIRKLWRLAS